MAVSEPPIGHGDRAWSPIRHGDPAWSPTPLAALEAADVPSEAHFVRDHFPAPEVTTDTWALRVEGTEATRTITFAELTAWPSHALRVVLECAGHRRREFTPPAPGLQWGAGAVGEAVWTGVPLASLLREIGIPSGASHVILEGGDRGAFPGLDGEHSFARALPLEKALDGDVLLAWAMNDEALPVPRGGPVRAIVPGWYATDSIKWLARIAFAEGPWGGPFEALDYRLREVGTDGAGQRMTAMPVNSLVTSPEPGFRLSPGSCVVRGIAWGGRSGIARVEIRVDDGPRLPARLVGGKGPYARTRWECRCRLEGGRHVISSRAVDGSSAAQPECPVPNAAGYGNNSVHRVEVMVA